MRLIKLKLLEQIFKKYLFSMLHIHNLRCDILSSILNKSKKKGDQFCSLKISNLNNFDITINLFVFGNVKGLVICEGTIIAVKSPKIVSFDQSKNVLRLSVQGKDKIVQFGQSNSFGKCASKTQSGEKCLNFVNM